MTIPDICPNCGKDRANDYSGHVFKCLSQSFSIGTLYKSDFCKDHCELADLKQRHASLVDAARNVVDYYDNGDEEHSSQEMDLRIKKLSDTIAP